MRNHRAVLFLTLSIFAATAFAQIVNAPSLKSEVVWDSAERKTPLFVPAEAFQAGIESSPLSVLDRAFIARRVAESVEAHRCAGIELAHIQQVPVSERRSLSQMMDGARALVIGRVVATVTGWSSWSLEPAVLVWVEPDRVLHDRDGILGSATLFAFPVAEAELHFGQARLCSKAPGRIIPQAGDRVLLDVSDRIGDGRMVVVEHYFPIIGSDILPQTFADMLPFRALSLQKAGVDR